MLHQSIASFFSSLAIPPLFIPTLSLIMGIGLYALAYGFHISLATLGLISVAYALILTVSVVTQPHYMKGAILALGFYALGIGRTYHCYRSHTQFPFAQFSNPVTVHGTITNIAILPESRLKQCTTVAMHSIEAHTTHYEINIYSKPLSGLDVGDEVELHNIKLKPVEGDFKTYLMKEGILTTLFAQQVDYRILSRPDFSVRRFLFHQKIRIYNALHKKLSRPAFTFFAALFLGDRAHNKRYISKITDEFQYWGLMHYLARAGLHMVIFTATWEMLFRLVPLPFAIKQGTLLLLYILYFLLSWPSIPFVRAFLTVTTYKIFTLLKSVSHFLSTLTFICCALLVYNPLQLLFLDFQLSFFLTFALGWLNQHSIYTKKY